MRFLPMANELFKDNFAQHNIQPNHRKVTAQLNVQEEKMEIIIYCIFFFKLM